MIMHQSHHVDPRRVSHRVASVVALLAAAVHAPASAASAQRPDSSGYVTVEGGTRVHFQVYGSGRDTVIVPGGVILAAHLSALPPDFTLVFYDPRGRGRSDWVDDPRRVTVADEVRDLEAVRAHFNVSRVAIVGFSYLGLVSAIYAADNPQQVSRLVLMSPMAPDQQTSSRYSPPERKVRTAAANAKFTTARAGADTTDFAADCRRWYDAYGPLLVGDPTDASRITTEFCVQQNESPTRLSWRNDQFNRSLGRRWDYTRKATLIRVPTLVIQGDRDLVVSPDGARRWTELIPDARLIMLAGAGHLTYIERHERLMPALERFLKGQWPGEAMQLRTARD